MNQVYIFTHIPKTAGTSIRNHFARHLENHVEFIHLANRGHKQAERQGFENFYQKPRIERNKAIVILGHQVNKNTKKLIDKKPKEVVIFRDPISWEISRYNQYANRIYKEKGLLLTLEEWLNETNKLHSQFDWFLINYSKINRKTLDIPINDKCDLLVKELAHFEFIISLRSVDTIIKLICNRINIPSNISRRYNSVGNDKKQYFIDNLKSRDEIHNICKKDIQIYNYLFNANIIKA